MDEHCAVRQGFVCKKPAKGSHPPMVPLKPARSGFCPKGFRKFKSKCFAVFGGKTGQPILTWSDASKACQNLMSSSTKVKIHLASISSLTENGLLLLFLSHFVIGMLCVSVTMLMLFCLFLFLFNLYKLIYN